MNSNFDNDKKELMNKLWSDVPKNVKPIFILLFLIIIVAKPLWDIWLRNIDGSKAKVELNNSNLDQSPVIVDSPGTNVSYNTFTDKETLGIREPDGLYQNGKKVGRVNGFNANDALMTFTISEIEFDQSLRNSETIWQPYEFQNYIIQISHVDIRIGIPPGAKGINGRILERKVK